MLRLRTSVWMASCAAALAMGGGAAAQTAPPDTATAISEPAEDGLGETTAAATTAPPEPAPPPPAPTGPATISDAIAAGKLILEVRGRYEYVDQANLALHAKSVSVRTRIGWETADWHGLKALIEFEDVRHLDDDRYNVAVPGGASLNGKTQYPVVNDPEVTELNRAQIAWTPSPMLTVTGGRQRILIDDQRFVGNVGWRQDEQTFDGVRADFALGRFKATYVYVSHVNRIFGEKLDWRSDSHLINATYALAEPLRLEGFLYALDFSNSPTNASVTWGARGAGKVWAGLVQVAYDATFARQSDYRHNTAPYSLDYWQASAAATYDIFTLKADYESLQGNGTRGFTTPLATTHAFQGWADAFAAVGGNKTHVDGLRDFNVGLTLKPRWRWTYLFNIEAIVRYHDFDAERTGANLAREWDAQVQAAINPKLTAAIKYANYRREPTVPAGTTLAPPSRTKLWLTLEYKL